MKKRVLLGIGVGCARGLRAAGRVAGLVQYGQSGPPIPTRPSSSGRLSILIFVLMVTLGFILFRELVKLYIARQSNREGSRIRTKLVVGALALSCVPVVLPRAVQLRGPEPQPESLVHQSREKQVQAVRQHRQTAPPRDAGRGQRAGGAARRASRRSAMPQPAANFAAASSNVSPERRRRSRRRFRPPAAPARSWTTRTQPDAAPRRSGPAVPVLDGDRTLGYVELASPMPLDVADQVSTINRYNREYIELRTACGTRAISTRW